MNSITKFARIPQMVLKSRAIHVSAPALSSMQKFNPDRYTVPPRTITLDDTMEPYGSWKQAYEAERKNANKKLILGMIMFSTTCIVFYQSGVMDGLFMPNLDNIMEDTEPYQFDKEDRLTV